MPVATEPTSAREPRPPSGDPAVPAVHRGPLGGELAITVVVLAFSLFAVGMLVVELVWVLLGSRSAVEVVSGGTFAAIVLFLIYGNLVYQFCRFGSLRHHQRFPVASEGQLRRWSAGATPTLAVLVPSYKEELRTVEQTVMSAALQRYRGSTVTLLLDDPPDPTDPAARRALDDTFALVARIHDDLAARTVPVRESLRRTVHAAGTGDRDGNIDGRRRAARHLADLHDDAARWLDGQAARWHDGDHTDRFYAEQVLVALADELCRDAVALRRRAGPPSWRALITGHHDLLQVFECRLSCFQRKRYENLSHEPNKAMNLNAYLGLLGQRWREVVRGGRRYLEPAGAGLADLELGEPRYVLTLDADSLLLPGYAARLIHAMEQPGNERVAVIQTPYRAIPGPASTLERVAGATTDVQHVMHQGFAHFGATFWVGANALLRKEALDEIAEVDTERGHRIVRYVQDRTVIEDTESSIDLVDRGWSLQNYPAALAYSATPSDFGALVVQRRRWANGGLIILPKLLASLRRDRRPGRIPEALLRLHYLTSIAGTNVGLLLLLGYGFPGIEMTPWLPLSAVGYFALYTRDLCQLGYRASDVVRVYALNVLLVPVNLAGMLTSLRQGVTGAKIPFGRTPKVGDRTAVPKPYLVAPMVLVAMWAAAAVHAAVDGRPLMAVFTVLNIALLVYALGAFVRWPALRQDLQRRNTGRPSDKPSGAPGPCTCSCCAAWSNYVASMQLTIVDADRHDRRVPSAVA